MSDSKRFDLLIVNSGARKIAVYTPQFERIQRGDTVNFYFDGDAVSGLVIDVYDYQEYKGNLWKAIAITTGHEPVKCLSKTYTEAIEWLEEDDIDAEEKEENKNDAV